MKLTFNFSKSNTKYLVIIYNNTWEMDIFQFIGDFLHLIAVLMLLLKIVANKNVIGISSTNQVSLTAHNRSF